ncbi:hypothetical protein SAMN05443550_10455 [Pedobacter hartonius]|uniref:Uncharacterized protein n=1 Tax=Pedobacter hartonius TaxID=425514 RepID=A0A1H4CIJ3_9SPHI|nr:hypothetical protein SAMN05443550_10455 [Pedobacter hartonius]
MLNQDEMLCRQNMRLNTYMQTYARILPRQTSNNIFFKNLFKCKNLFMNCLKKKSNSSSKRFV